MQSRGRNDGGAKSEQNDRNRRKQRSAAQSKEGDLTYDIRDRCDARSTALAIQAIALDFIESRHDTWSDVAALVAQLYGSSVGKARSLNSLPFNEPAQ